MMRQIRVAWAIAVFLLCTASAAFAGASREADPAYLATIPDHPELGLPRGKTAEERAMPELALPSFPTVAPSGPVRAQAEYEPTHGILIRWGNYDALQTSMVVPLTMNVPASDVWVVVSGSSQQNSATNVLQGGGANMAHVHFVTANTDSVWMRDYGPRFVGDSGRRAIVNHTYNRSSRPNDNLFPSVFGTYLNESVYDIPLRLGGGNFHLFRNRDAFMTRLVTNENLALTEQQIKDDFALYDGVNVTLTDPFPTSYDSTQHIDMWMLPLADNKVIIGQYAAGEGGGVPKTVTDATATDLTSRGYTVYRTEGWHTGSGNNVVHYTYTNSVIVNQVVLICKFGGSNVTRDATALATYQAALPASNIVQVDCSGIIGNAGAIHCIVMHVPDWMYRDTFGDGF
ncbi:MAG: agmatine deiminase family protein [Dokdonella sp.]